MTRELLQRDISLILLILPILIVLFSISCLHEDECFEIPLYFKIKRWDSINKFIFINNISKQLLFYIKRKQKGKELEYFEEKKNLTAFVTVYHLAKVSTLILQQHDIHSMQLSSCIFPSHPKPSLVMNKVLEIYLSEKLNTLRS